MQAETVLAAFLLVCLGCFFSVNLHSVLVVRKRRIGEKSFAEVEHPSSFSVGLAVVGTFAYFLEAFAYLFLVFSGLIYTLHGFPFDFSLSFSFFMQVLGLIFSSAGYFLFIWSVIARGRYSVSWEMPQIRGLSLGVLTVMFGIRLILVIFSCFLGSSVYGLTCLRFFRSWRFPDTFVLLLKKRGF